MLKNSKKAEKYLDFTVTAVVQKDAGDECIVEGYANTSSKDRVGDVVMPKAFVQSLPVYLKNPVLLENHNWDKVAGRVIHAEVTDKGLFIKARISDTRPDLKTMIREGCLSTFSIGYNEIDADYDESTKTKYIKNLELLEISVVSVPANTEASFTVVDTKKPEAAPAAAPAAAPKGAEGTPVEQPKPEPMKFNNIGEPLCPGCGKDMKLEGESYKCAECGKEYAKSVKVERGQGESLESCVSRGIATLINEGKAPDQAAAIAYSMCGEKAACAECAKHKSIKPEDLKSFIAAANEASDGKLETDAVVALCDYFITEGNDMKLNRKQLIEALRATFKSAQAAAAPIAAAPAAGTPEAGKADAPADQGSPAAADGDLMKQLMAKLDAIAQGIAQVLEGMKAEESAEGDDQGSGDAAPAEPPKPAPGKEGTPGDAQTPPPADAGKGLEGMSAAEVDALEADIDAQLAELEDLKS